MKQMAELSQTFQTVINGDAEKGYKGHEERLSGVEGSIARFYKIAGAIGLVSMSVLGYFAKMFWARMNEVMAVIEAADKVVK